MTYTVTLSRTRLITRTHYEMVTIIVEAENATEFLQGAIQDQDPRLSHLDWQESQGSDEFEEIDDPEIDHVMPCDPEGVTPDLSEANA